MVQVAKRGASVLKRRKSRNRMEPPSSTAAAAASCSSGYDGPPPRSESDGDVVFYVEEPRSGEFIFIYMCLKEFGKGMWREIFFFNN